MPTTYTPGRTNFGLLPEPEGRSIGFIMSSCVNLTILGVILLVGMTARQVIERHYEMTQLIIPQNPPPPIKIKPIVQPKMPPPPEPPKIKLEERKIVMPKPQPAPKPVEMEAKLTIPQVKAEKPQIVLAPQPKAAITAAAMPAQNNQPKPSTAPVHLGQTFGATPNPNATRPATIAAIGNPGGGQPGAGCCSAWRCGLNSESATAPNPFANAGTAPGKSRLGRNPRRKRHWSGLKLRQSRFGGDPHSRQQHAPAQRMMTDQVHSTSVEVLLENRR